MTQVKVESYCPNCKSPALLTAETFLSTRTTPDVRSRLLAGEIGLFKCSGCQFVVELPFPLIYDDPDLGLVTFVCDGDRESLIEEFHDFLRICKSDMSEALYEDILQKPFQIVVGIRALIYIVQAKIHGTHCYIISPGLSEVPLLHFNYFLIVAKHYRIVGRNMEAYAVLKRAALFPNSNPEFYQELGAYAYTAGRLSEAESAVAKSIELRNACRHVWQQVIPGESQLGRIPDQIALGVLLEHVRSSCHSTRHEFSLSTNEHTVLAGTMAGLMERALMELGPDEELQYYLGVVQAHFDNFCSGSKEDRRVLEEIYEKYRRRALTEPLVEEGKIEDQESSLEVKKPSETPMPPLERMRALSQSGKHGAWLLCRMSELDCRRRGDKDGLARALSNEAMILEECGDLDGAISVCREGTSLFRELRCADGHARALGYLASLLHSKGDLAEAIALYKEKVDLCRELLDNDSLIDALGSQANMLQEMGDPAGSLALLKEVESLCRGLQRKEGIRMSLNGQARILFSLEDLEGSVALLQEEQELCRELGNLEALAQSLEAQAIILSSDPMRRSDARHVVKDALAVATEIGNQPLMTQIEELLETIQALVKLKDKL